MSLSANRYMPSNQAEIMSQLWQAMLDSDGRIKNLEGLCNATVPTKNIIDMIKPLAREAFVYSLPVIFNKDTNVLTTRQRDYVNAVLDTASLDLTLAGQTLSGAVLPAGVDHNSLLNYDANRHIDHTAVSISAGTGLTGGGTIAANRTISLSHLGIQDLTTPAGDRIMFYDDSAGKTGWLTVSTGLNILSTVLTCTITQYTDALARAAISTTVTGLTYTAATGVLSLTAGYVIPTTTEETNWNSAYSASHARGHGLFTALDHTDVGTYLAATNPLLETSGPQFAKLGIGKPADAFRDATYTPQIVLSGGPSDADLFAPVDGESGVLTIDGVYYYPYMVFVAIDANTLTGPVHARPPNNSIAITTKTYNYSRSGGTVTVTPVAGEPPGISVHAVGTMITVSLTDSYSAGYDDPGDPPYNIPPYTGSYPTAELVTSHTIDHANISAHAVSSADDALLSVAGGGRFAGIINMETHRLTSLAAPTTAGDAIRQTATITEASLGTALGYLDQSVKVAGTPEFARVGIGLAAHATLQLNMARSGAGAGMVTGTYSTTASHSSNIYLLKSANATIGTLAATAATEYFGQIISQGINSSNAVATGSLILFGADGAPGATYIPSKISFYTGTDAAGVAERMTLDKTGKLTLVGDFAHQGTNFGVCNTAPHAQIAHVADATDAATVITRCNAILATLELFGFHAAA